MIKFKGVIPPMITPFKENGDVDYDGFTKNILKWNDTKLTGYLVLGSNSETVYLTEEEKMELVKITVQSAAKGRHVMVGSGMESVRETIRLTNKCAKVGAQSALVLTPFYYGGDMTSEAIIKFFTAVADNSDIPILLYNVPKYTHINIKADAVQALSQHKNIIGMKDSSGDVPQFATFKRVAAPDFNVITGTFASWYPALTLDGCAVISAMANCCPNEIADVQEAFDAGDLVKARTIYQRMFPVNAAVTATYGVAGLKYASTYLGYNGGYTRSPLLNTPEADRPKIKAIIDKALA